MLDLIHEQAPSIPFRPSVVEQLHRDLYQYTTVPAGRWKTTENAIEEELPDGTKRVRFRTVAAADTPAAMDELHAAFVDTRDAGEHHPLLLIGCYVFDFLAIHPFRDGNGRMARLLTLLLLYQSGYGVGRYVSLERLVNDAKEGYYRRCRRRASAGTTTSTRSGRGSSTCSASSWPRTANSRIGSGCSPMAAGRRPPPSSASFATASPTSSPSRMSARLRSEPAIRSSARSWPASATRE